MTRSTEEFRAARMRWIDAAPGMTPGMAAKFKLGVRSGKTIRDMTTSKGPDYICSMERFRTHCTMNPKWWGDREKWQNKQNSNNKKSANSWSKLKTHCGRGHDLAVHGRRLVDDSGRHHRRCGVCALENQRGSGIIRTEAVDKVKEALRSGVRIATILKTIMRPPVYNLLRQRDPSINDLVEETKPLRTLGPGSRGGVSHLLRKPKIIVPGAPKVLVPRRAALAAFEAINEAVSGRYDHDTRMEAISLTTMDFLEKRIGMDDIPAAARKHLAAVHSAKKYSRSVDEPRFRDGATPWIETIEQGLWT